MELVELTELLAKWERLLGRTPGIDLFMVWGGDHGFFLIRHAVVKTASQNMAMQWKMTDDHRLRYASAGMINYMRDPETVKL
jgi:hypothetical protein